MSVGGKQSDSKQYAFHNILPAYAHALLHLKSHCHSTQETLEPFPPG